jgi:hypothetical protein
MVISLVEDISCLLGEGHASCESFSRKHSGFWGCGNAVLSLLNIKTTDDMLGLSLGRCCTHKRLTWMHHPSARLTVDTGRTVVCTIHQPSIDIFKAFVEVRSMNSQQIRWALIGSLLDFGLIFKKCTCSFS